MDTFADNPVIFWTIIIITILSILSNINVIIVTLSRHEFHHPNNILAAGLAVSDLAYACLCCLISTLDINWDAINDGKRLEGTQLGGCIKNDTVPGLQIDCPGF